jgi:hypothetical protein
METLAASWHQSNEKTTATRQLADPEAVIPEQMDERDKVQAFTLKNWISERHGDELAGEVEKSPAWPSLVSRVRYLRDETDMDAREMVHESIDRRPLTDAKDPAAVITARVNASAAQERARDQAAVAVAERPAEAEPARALDHEPTWEIEDSSDWIEDRIDERLADMDRQRQQDQDRGLDGPGLYR